MIIHDKYNYISIAGSSGYYIYFFIFPIAVNVYDKTQSLGICRSLGNVMSNTIEIPFLILGNTVLQILNCCICKIWDPKSSYPLPKDPHLYTLESRL